MWIKLAAVALVWARGLGCPGGDERCISCNGGVCSICIDSYIDEQGRCQPVGRRIKHCVSYNSGGGCKVCQHPYFTDAKGRCARIPLKNCAELDQASNCAICSGSLMPLDGRCDSGQRCPIENCEQCALVGSAPVCVKCRPKFAILIEKTSNYRCIPQATSSPNCIYLNNLDPSKCTICEFNFFWKHAQCAPSRAYRLDLRAPLAALPLLLLLLLN